MELLALIVQISHCLADAALNGVVLVTEAIALGRRTDLRSRAPWREPDYTDSSRTDAQPCEAVPTPRRQRMQMKMLTVRSRGSD